MGIGWKGPVVAPTEAGVRPEGGPGFRAAAGGGKVRPPRGCGHIAIYHNPAYVFIIAMLIQPSFRRKPESIAVRRFRLAPE